MRRRPTPLSEETYQTKSQAFIASHPRIASDPLGENLFHGIHEDVDFMKRGVNIRGDSDPLELGVLGGRRHDSVLFPEISEDFPRVDSLDLNEGDSARNGVRSRRGPELDSGVGGG